ncbi:baseplate J/gp47 family protein [Cohnella lupini]|uniref:Putative phage baseplate assembly protein n=1 Tax=Cohnella lupini TaxID=1294267 RepID=A0A3D9I574_9BACL|nr:baseplate J/gp47 family protein [Cohnella lupini]RED56790.1 putative phage baseplate assembly protein [Cohnella lupini]
MNSELWQDGISRSPAIDGRDLDALIDQMKAMVPHYTPEWRFSPEDPDAGTALFYLAAEMLGENIKRLNRVPLNNFIAFLDLLQVNIQPARAARAHVVFALNEGVREPVYVPSGTLLTARPNDEGEELPYETEGALLITPAKLTELYNVHPDRDRIVLTAEQYDESLLAGSAPEVPLFSVEGDNLQDHALYIRNDDLFHLDHPAKLTLKWHNSERRYVEGELATVLSREDWLEWSYSKGNEWIPFEKATALGQEITLWKKSSGAVEETEINGLAGRWIRCRVKPTAAGENGPPVLKAIQDMDRVTMRATHDRELDPEGIMPNELYFNDLQLDRSGFYPFGEYSVPYSVFYASCPEAFSKRGSRLRMSFKARNVPNALRMGPDPEIRWKMVMRTADFEKKPLPRLYIRRVQWEYWNGDNWMKLPESGSFEEMFAGFGEEQKDVVMEFPCPEDMAPTFVNGREDCWLRARVTATDTPTAPVVEYMSPRIEQLAFSYEYARTANLRPDSALTLNNAVLKDVTATARQGGDTFKPFLPIPCPAPSVYMAFDVPPVKGPIRLQFTLGRKPAEEEQAPWIEWEAYVRNGVEWSWEALKIVDDTQGFTQSGALQFVGPSGLALATLFGRERVWLRAVNRDGKYGAAEVALPSVTGIHRNSVLAIQQRTILNEYPESSKGGRVLSQTPIVGQEVWVDETGHIAEHELGRLADNDPERYEIYRDSEGAVQRLWVRWDEVRSLAGSSGDERHYTIQPTTGFMQFGNGVRGMAPPHEGGDKVRVTYRVTNGARGNVGAGQLAGIMQSLAFVNGVSNPASAIGGGDPESLEGALRRGPQQLKHRGRAISASDVEWLVKEIDPGILKVKCLPNRNARLAYSPGSMVVVALPSGGGAGKEHFPETKRKLEKALRSKASNMVVAGGKLCVMAPAFIEISVIATIIVDSSAMIIPAEIACLDVLKRFLNPVSGQMDGQGWEIGEPVHASAFYGLLQSVRGVQRVEQLHISVMRSENGETAEMLPEDIRLVLNGIVSNGLSHRLNVTIA